MRSFYMAAFACRLPPVAPATCSFSNFTYMQCWPAPGSHMPILHHISRRQVSTCGFPNSHPHSESQRARAYACTLCCCLALHLACSLHVGRQTHERAGPNDHVLPQQDLPTLPAARLAPLRRDRERERERPFQPRKGFLQVVTRPFPGSYDNQIEMHITPKSIETKNWGINRQELCVGDIRIH